MTQNGFTLIECTIYSFILALLSVLAFQFFIVSYQKFSAMTRTGQQYMALYATHDLLVRDIQGADADIGQWDLNDNAGFICQSNQNSIAWIWKNGNIYRIAGDYDFVQRQWNKKSQALVASNVSKFDCESIRAATSVLALKIELGIGADHNLEKTVPLYNREMV